MGRWTKGAIASPITWISRRIIPGSISPTRAAGRQQSAPASADGGRTGSKDAMENSPLSRLPAELRNAIYEYALYEPRGIPVLPGSPPDMSTLSSQQREEKYTKLEFRTRKPAFLALSLTCKAVRQEIRGIYSSVNDTIDYRSSRYDLYPCSPVQRLAKIFGKESRYKIGHIRLYVSYSDISGTSSDYSWQMDQFCQLYAALQVHFLPQTTTSVVLDTGFYYHKRGKATVPITLSFDLDHVREVKNELDDYADLALARRARPPSFWERYGLGGSWCVYYRDDDLTTHLEVAWFLYCMQWWMEWLEN